MDTVLFGTATVVDLVLTGAFVTIMRRSRTGILGYGLHGPRRGHRCWANVFACRPYSALDILSRYALYASKSIYICQSIRIYNGTYSWIFGLAGLIRYVLSRRLHFSL